jgi:hypothetical protein
MPQVALPECVYNDLNNFISTYYPEHSSHPLLIAQAFCLRFQKHGEKFGLSIITNTVECIRNSNNNHWSSKTIDKF